MPLKTTPEMLRQGEANKMVGWLPDFHPLDFLRLTCPEPNVFRWIEQESAGHTKSLDEYNHYASIGKSIHMPWLDVDVHTGKVIGHEGRHRAIAVHLANERKMAVGICLREKGYPVYYWEDTSGHPWVKTYVSKINVPPVFVGQFVHREIPVDVSHLNEFWAKYNH